MMAEHFPAVSPTGLAITALLVSVHTITKLVQLGRLTAAEGTEIFDDALLNAETAQALSPKTDPVEETRALLGHLLETLKSQNQGQGPQI